MTFDAFLGGLSNTALSLCLLFIAIFAGDFLVLRYRIAAHGAASATDDVTTYQAAMLKDNKYTVYYDQPQTQSCTRSIFPWLGHDPCWYLRRHNVKIVN